MQRALNRAKIALNPYQGLKLVSADTENKQTPAKIALNPYQGLKLTHISHCQISILSSENRS